MAKLKITVFGNLKLPTMGKLEITKVGILNSQQWGSWK